MRMIITIDITTSIAVLFAPIAATLVAPSCSYYQNIPSNFPDLLHCSWNYFERPEKREAKDWDKHREME